MWAGVKRVVPGVVFFIAIAVPFQAYAACQIVGTTMDGYIIVCDGPDTIGVASGVGSDIITINVGADVTKMDVQSVDVTATATATTIDAGSGNNQVTNNGSVGANAGANALPVDGSASQATANATGIKAGDGADVIQNSSTITSTATSNSTSGDISITLGGHNQSQSMTTSTAAATGIAGGGGNNQIINSGVITVTGTSQSDAPFIDLDLTYTAYADVSVTAEVTGTGILGGEGDDSIDNTGTITVTGTSQASTGNLNVKLGDSATAGANATAYTTSTGISGKEGNDAITSSGPIAVNATSNAEGSIDLESSTNAEINATIEAKSTAIGIDGGGGDDTITNQSSLSATSIATAASDNINTSIWAPGVIDTTVKSIAVSTGILSDSGKDVITNEGSITVYSEATTEVSNVLLSGGIEVALPTDVKGGATSEATAIGIDAGDGDDRIMNDSTINASAKASTSSEGVLLTLVGVGTFATTTTATARSTGIEGGAGKDEITNSGIITVNATSNAESLSVSISALQYEAVSDGDAKTRSEAYATGIAAGDGDDKVTNTGTATANANAKSSTKDISVEYMGAARGNSSTTSYALATGIDGGTGNDEITNSGAITVNANSEVYSLGIDVKRNEIPLDPLEWFGTDLGDARTAAQAKATGIEGGDGEDTITNSGTIAVSSKANASSDDIIAELGIGSGSESPTASISSFNLNPPMARGGAGATAQVAAGAEENNQGDNAIANAGTIALATASGIAGGPGNDVITNNGRIFAKAEAEADSLSIGVTVSYERSEFLDILGGISLTDTTTTSQAKAVGIDGGAGNDTINNTMEINVEAISNATSATIKAHFQGDFTEEKDGGIEYEIGASLVKSGTEAIASATGIAGCDGDDTITNSGKVIAKAISDADSATVSATLIGAKEGLVAGVSYADATTKAQASVTGIDGGAGNDTINNTGEIEVTADPTSSSASVSATITGVMKGKEKVGIVAGAALTDGTTKAIGIATGIYGGDGDDTIANFGKIIVRSNPDADSASVSVNLGAAMGELGLVGGFSYADSTTTAEATAFGIDGGSGNDTLSNSGEIEVTAEPTSSSASIAVTAQGVKGMGAAVGISLTDGTTKAISSATGIAGSEGDDTIINSGKITVKALPDADSASVSVSLSAAKEGVAAGGTFADTTTTAQATAIGIDGGQGNDTINNSGEIEVAANSTSSSASIGVTITGVKEGAGLGVALTDGTTKAISAATGITGGDGNNIITNSGNITVTAISDADSASVSATLGGAGEGLVAGVSYADATTTAEATGVGIETGKGKDIIQNDGLLNVNSEATATSASVAVNAGGAVEGAAVGVALTDAETKAKSSSTGIEGGGGEDTIINTGTITVSAKSDVTAASVSVDFEATGTGVAGGVSLANGDTTVEAYAIGINGNSGNGTIFNNNVVNVNAESTSTLASISVAVHGTPEGISLGAALASASNTAKASAIGIQGGDDNDIIANTGTITVSATSKADTTSVALDAECAPVGLGASLAKANTTVEAIAKGLSGGSGDDEITNTDTINVSSSATGSSKAISVSIATASYSSADASTTAIAKSTGMDGGSGADTILNSGTINLTATSNADGKAGSANLTGYAAADVDITAEATTTGIDGGAEYNDIDNLVNTGTIKTLSDATAKGISVSVNLLGGVATDANTTARAITTGIKGGVGEDLILNQGSIELTAKSNADVLGVSVTLGGYSDSNAESKAESMAIGINAGDGVNTIVSKGSIKVSSEAYADTASVSVNLLGYAAAKGGATASATAIGITSGKDADSIQNEGMIDLNALSDTYASATSVQLMGIGESNAKGISNAMVKGIDSGDGNNTIINTSTGVITGTVTAYADASSYDIQLAGGAKATAGTEAIATAIGIAGGKDVDTIRNEGTINLAAQSTLVSESRSYKIFGFGFADADSMAFALATGIDGGNGANTIANASTGSITVSSNASATATSMTANIGVAGASASTTSRAHSTGIKSGGDEDTIINEGILKVNATSSTYAGSGDFSLIGLSFGDSLTEAIADGINAGGGNDVVLNTGSITVGSVQDNNHPMAYSNVDSVSFSFFNISSANFGSKAQATGIIGGGGDDTILNAGTITVGDDDWMAKGRGYGFSGNFFEFFSLTDVGATAETVSTGIEGGDGNDTILNDSSGVLTIKATSYARTEGAADTTTFGNPAAFTSSTTKATATGISGGEGDDLIENKGKIDVYAQTLADAYSDSWVGWGEPSSDSTADATAMALGINAGGGQNFIMNSGVINVKALAETTPYAKADSNVDTTDSETTSYSKSTAFGILAGDGGNTVNNTATGAITVTAIARTYDAQGNIAKAESDEKSTVTAGSVTSPITADAVGISLGKGDDTVTNDGTITVNSQSDARVSAYTNSWPYDAQSDATAYAAATAKGIAAGVGANEVINNGQISVNAWSHANPITDSWSRDQTAIANATSNSNAVAIGIEADGNVVNTSLGNIDVTARVTTYADANTYAETTTATANLMATATGISTASNTGRAIPDRIQNDGIITVTAVAGEDENGNVQEIAYADTDTWVTSCKATATGTSTVDATGIRVGERGAEITNNGNLEVFGRARAYVRAYADSRDYHPYGNGYSTGIATATGISAAGGDNLINNYSTMKVEARVQDAYARGDTWSSWSTCRSLAETNATATATGIRTKAGKDEINNYGQLTVIAEADAESYAWADTRDNNIADEYETTTARAQADGTGMDAGEGNNLVNHSGSMTVSAVANAKAGAGGGHASVTAMEQAVSSAVGIQTGSGDDSIIIRPDSELVATAEGTAGNDANVRVTGIDASDGINILKNESSISVVAKAISGISAEAEVWGIKTGSSSDMITLGTDSLINAAANATTFSYNGATGASAIGIEAGDGDNQITNHGFINVNADATAEVKRVEFFGWSITYPATAVSNVTGIKSGQGADIINNYGEIRVNSEASAVINQVLDLSAGTKSATANAIGIDAGDGDNVVTNYGSINISAIAAAGTGASPRVRTDGVESTTAIGIMTGSGNDTIINSGSITTANQRLEWVGGWIHITSQPGIAISSGGGNDQVSLMNGSTTTGSIDLGDGNDWLTLVGTPVVTGNVTGANGIDTLVFDGTGSIDFTPMAFENAIKQGAGIFTVANLPTMQRIEIKQGVLQVNNNYQFSNSGFFQTIVNGDGSFGQFKVNGTTELSGDLSVLKGPGPYKNGTTYNIIEANAVNNTFGNVTLPPPNNFVSFGMDQFPTLVQIEVYAKDFSWLVRNRVEWAVANYLDRILPSATGDLFGMLGQIQNLSQSEFYKALSSLSPDSYDNFTRTTFSATHRYTKSLHYRMNNVRSYLYANGSGNEAPILLAYRGSDVSQLYNPERVSQIQGKNGLWFDAFGQWGDQGAKKGYTGYDYFMRGAILGFDHAVSDKLMAGVSVGYSRADVDLDRHQGSGDIKSLFGSIYGSYFNKNLYIDGALSYGRNWYNNHRLITIGALQRKAHSDHEGNLFTAFLGGGYYFDIKKWLIGPFASLHYIYLDEESFKEKGADSLSLRVNGRKTDSLVSELGVRLSRAFKTHYGNLIPEVSAAWLHDFDIDDRVITSSFAGSPGASFSIKGQDVERNGATLGAGITFVHKSGLSTSLKYIGEFREKYRSNGVMGELRFTF